MLGHPIMD